MNKAFTIDELTQLRCDLTYAAQKVSNIMISKLSEKMRAKHTEFYSPEDLATAQKELDVSRFQLQEVSDRMLPAIQAIAQEGITV